MCYTPFVSSGNPRDIITLINTYPEFKELYKDISEFRTSPKELIHMYSEALAIADRNTVRLMIDDMKDQNDELKKQCNNLKEQNNGLKEQVSSLTTQVAEKEMENSRLKQLLLDSGINPDQAFSK